MGEFALSAATPYSFTCVWSWGAGGLGKGSMWSPAGCHANSQHHSLSFLWCGRVSLNKQQAWKEVGGAVSISLIFTLISNRHFRCEKINFLSFWNAVMQKLRFPFAGSEEQGGLHGSADAWVGQTLPIWQKWLIGSMTQALCEACELRGSLTSDPLLPWRFAFSPCLTPALICICNPAWAAPDAFPVPCFRFWGAAIVDLELLPPPGAHYMRLPLQLPGGLDREEGNGT